MYSQNIDINNKLCVVHNTSGVGPTSFGVGHIALNLMRAEYELGINSMIWCVGTDEDVRWAVSANNLPENTVINFPSVGPNRLSYSPAMMNAAKSGKYNVDIIHQHGIWAAVSMATLKMRQFSGIPTIVAPHGSLSQWALNTSKLKKEIALFAYERSNLNQAACLHATSENEISDFRDFGLKNPIAYIQNGMQEEDLVVEGNRDRFFVENGVDPNKRILFFISRISPKKGLLMLVEAINTIKDDFKDWQLIIAGVDEFNHAIQVKSLISKLQIEDKVKIVGPLFGEAKSDAFAAAELFILPSYSEGSPMVVLESLSAGVPVITTKASVWQDLINHNCGWWTEINTQAITAALQESIKMSPENLKNMGRNGRKLVSSKFTWPHSAKKAKRLYNWLLDKDDRPDFVILD